ncbi:hypothetical protein QS257_11775 [Terrilactibacillus sp. S3-3]|nr:hypothetical protein QS257_11775 [Terrilactibacillus sp. S3-3]
MQRTAAHFIKSVSWGECQAAGDIDCETFKVMGTCRVLGGLKTGFFRNLGEVTVKGPLQTDEMRILGTTEVKMDCRVKKAKISGELSCKDFYGEEANVRGSLVVKGNAETESMRVRGWISVEGMLNSDNVDIVLRHGAENHAGEIGAGRVQIKRKRSLMGTAAGGHFTAGVIEGDDIYLDIRPLSWLGEAAWRSVRDARLALLNIKKVTRLIDARKSDR